MTNIDIETLHEFIRQSNAIEDEYSDEAFQDALLAWGYGYTAIIHNEGRIGVSDILVMHAILMKRLDPNIAGKLRAIHVMVGDRVCPAPWLVQGMLDNWVLDYGDCSQYNESEAELSIKHTHIAFERIHSFQDGNGRVGRLIMNLQRVYNDLPLLVIHTGKEQEEYYEWF